MKVLVISADPRSLVQFRRDLMVKMKEKGHEVMALSPINDERGDSSCLEKEGIKVNFVDIDRTGLNPFHDLKAFYEIFTIVKKFKPDVVFSFTIKPVIYGSLASFFGGAKRIYSLIPGVGHVFLNKSWGGKVLRFLVSRMYQISLITNSKVFFQNNDDLDLFISKRILKRKKAFKVNGSGVNTDEFKRNETLPKRPVFLLAGRIIKEKGIKEYVEAVRVLKKNKGYSFKAFLVGGFDKNPTSFNEKSLKDLNFDGVIDYLGDQSDMKSVFEKSSVYVLPSYREGTPRSTLEAMSMMMPVVTTDVPGCRETVKEGVNGFLVGLKSVSDLAKSMEKFIINSELISIMGSESLKIVRDKFDVRKVNQVYLEEMGL